MAENNERYYVPSDPSLYAGRTPTQTLDQFLAKYAPWIGPDGKFRGDRAGGGEGIGTDNYLAKNGIRNELNGLDAAQYFNQNIGFQRGSNGIEGSDPTSDYYADEVNASFTPNTFNWGRTLGDFAKNTAIAAAAAYGANGLLENWLPAASEAIPSEAGVKTLTSSVVPFDAGNMAPLLPASGIPIPAELSALAALPAITESGTGLLSTVANGAKTVGNFLADNKGLGLLAGGLLGAAASGDTKTEATSTKDPWGPAKPYLLDNLKQNKEMQDYYRANPFSAEQKSAYQGVFDANANGMANVPGMLGMANAFGQSNRGKLGAMPQFTSGTTASPIDWSKYANVGLLGGK